MSTKAIRSKKLIRGGIAFCVISVCSAASVEYFMQDRSLALNSLLGVLFGAWVIQKGYSFREKEKEPPVEPDMNDSSTKI